MGIAVKTREGSGVPIVRVYLNNDLKEVSIVGVPGQSSWAEEQLCKKLCQG